MSTSELSIVIVSYNSADWLKRCLDSVAPGLGRCTGEIVVVDNGSTDASVQLVRQLYPEVLLLENGANAGFAAAVNAGVRASSAEWVLLLNPDTECRPGALEQLLNFALSHPGHGIYGGRTLNPDGSLQPSSCWALPTLWSTTCFTLGLSTVFAKSARFDPESMGSWQRDSVREVGMVTGCLLLVARTVWTELNGLDERYFVYGEDADFAARARRRGYRPIITPAAEVIHEVGASSGSEGAKLALLLAGKLTYARSHFGRRTPIAVALLRLGVAGRAAGARVSGRGTKWATAWAQRESWWDGFPARTESPRAEDSEAVTP